MRSEALRILDQLHELRGHKYVMAYWMALIYSALKERDEAFRWLDTALEERSAQLACVVWIRASTFSVPTLASRTCCR